MKDTDIAGEIKSVSGQIAQVKIITGEKPAVPIILTSPNDNQVRLEVYRQSHDTVSCLILSDPLVLYRCMPIVSTNSDLKIPVDESILGRIINIFGEPQDDPSKPLIAKTKLSIFAKTPPLHNINYSLRIIETGIKAIDFIT